MTEEHQLRGFCHAAVRLVLHTFFLLPLPPPAQVLVTPVGRLKVCGLGVSEALAGEVVPSGADDLLQMQRDDVVVSSYGQTCRAGASLWLCGGLFQSDVGSGQGCVMLCCAARGFLRVLPVLWLMPAGPLCA